MKVITKIYIDAYHNVNKPSITALHTHGSQNEFSYNSNSDK